MTDEVARPADLPSDPAAAPGAWPASSATPQVWSKAAPSPTGAASTRAAAGASSEPSVPRTSAAALPAASAKGPPSSATTSLVFVAADSSTAQATWALDATSVAAMTGKRFMPFSVDEEWLQ